MALIVRNKSTGETKRVLRSSSLVPRCDWEIVERVRSTPEEVLRDVGTGLPPQPRGPRPDRRTHG